MNFEEINLRVNRIKLAVRFDDKDGELGYTKFLRRQDGAWTLSSDNIELIIKIQSIISEIAAIKDHLILFLKNNDVEGTRLLNEFIGQTFELQLLLDLNNYFKHGPLRKSWTNLQPELVNLSAAGGFQFRSAPKGSPLRKITMNLKDGKVIKEGPGVNTVISGELIDKDRKYICSLDQMIDSSVSAIEYFVKTHAVLK